MGTTKAFLALSVGEWQELAGIVDEWGSLTLATQRTSKRKYRYEVYRLTANTETLNRFRTAFGGGIYENGTESGPVWKITGDRCRRMLSWMSPYLSKRRSAVERLWEVRRALSYDDGTPETSSVVSAAIREFEEVSRERVLSQAS